MKRHTSGRETNAGDSSDWAPISDLMAALMMIFMFMMIVFLRNLKDGYREDCKQIHQQLEQTFKTDFEEWNVTLLEDLTIRFTNPDLLFEQRSTNIRARFDGILHRFLPEYLKLLHEVDSKPEEWITEIRIEGHSSSEWADGMSEREAYIRNMELSQGRARAIVDLAIDLPVLNDDSLYHWAIRLITANGLSSARPIWTQEDEEASRREEDREASRRIEFRIVALSCQRGGVYET